MHEGEHFSCIYTDEAYCCPKLGHEFWPDYLPDYRKLDLLQREFSTTPIIALSKSRSPTMLDDVASNLEM